MAVDQQAVLEKMIRCCDNACKYAKDISYETFAANELFVTYAVFSLSQLGELAGVLATRTELCNLHPEVPWSAIRAMRNNIVHDYDGLRMQVVWDTIQKDLPVFREQLVKMLQ